MPISPMPEPLKSPDPLPKSRGNLTTGSPQRAGIFLACVLVAWAVSAWATWAPDLSPAGHRALFVLVLAVMLWVTDVVPAFAVGMLIIALKILLLGKPQGVFAQTDKDWESFVAVMGHPLIWLFFGGFVLAEGLAQCGLDRNLARALLPRFGRRPSNVLLGLMVITFGLSMVMSNTATTALMLAILAPLLATLSTNDPQARGFLLAIALSANLGGMGSLIGTPPNAIAVGLLADLNPPVTITFFQWLLLGFPPALASLLIGWITLRVFYFGQTHAMELDHLLNPTGSEHDSSSSPHSRLSQYIVACTLILTVGLWLTTQWHGLPTAAVSFVPIVALTITGVIGAQEIRGLPYDVLFLMAGGLALGQMVTETGLSQWIVDQLPLENASYLFLAVVLAYVTMGLSNFMSNTAAANILIPLSITMAPGHEVNVALPMAFATSAAMCLPVATPPNAMVFATGRVPTKHFVFLGLFFGLLVPALGMLWLYFTLNFVLPVNG